MVSIVDSGNSRVKWIDIYKGILILLVVIGHSTGKFNGYIYQFHVGAFFFISGYVSNLEKKDPFIVLINKFFTLFLPLTVMVTLWGTAVRFFALIGIEEFLFGYRSDSFIMIMRNYLCSGFINIQPLGAAWFIIALIAIFLLESVIIFLSKAFNCQRIVLIVLTVISYFSGYYLHHFGITKKVIWVSLDLLLITSSLFAFGVIIKQVTFIFAERKWYVHLVGVAINFLIMLLVMKKAHLTIDLASMRINSPISDLFIQINGIMLIYNISVLVSKYLSSVSNLLIFIGKNTLSVLFGHFAVFKIIFIIMFKCNIMTAEQVAGITPPQDIGNIYWPMLAFLSIFVSIFSWNVINRVPAISFILGENREQYKYIAEKIECLDLVKNLKNEIVSFCNRFRIRIIIKAILVLCVFMVLSTEMLTLYKIHNEKKVELGETEGWNSAAIRFGSGFLEKSEEENYLWINSEGTMTISGRLNHQINIGIYVPENFDEVSSANLLIDGKQIENIDFSNERYKEVVCDLTKIELFDDDYEVTIVFNGVHTPKENSNDLRMMSGMINHIYVE